MKGFPKPFAENKAHVRDVVQLLFTSGVTSSEGQNDMMGKSLGWETGPKVWPLLSSTHELGELADGSKPLWAFADLFVKKKPLCPDAGG